MIFAEGQFLWGLMAVPCAVLAGWLAISAARARLARFAARIPFRTGRSRLDIMLEAAALALLVCALAGPETGESEAEQRTRPLDVVVALDTSRSMWARDAAPSRIERAGREIRALIEELEAARPGQGGGAGGLRIGLVEFAGTARLVCPLTTDAETLRALLEGANGRGLEREGTHLSAGLEAALDAFDEETVSERVVILVTDGEERGDAALFEQAVAAARERDVLVSAIVVGTSQGARIPLPGNNGFVVDRDGAAVLSAARSELPALAASRTGGACLTMAEHDFPMDALLEETAGRLAERARPFPGEADRSLFQWFVLAALVLLLAVVFLPERRLPARLCGTGILAALPAALLLASCGSGGGIDDAREGNNLLRAGDARAAVEAYERSLRDRPGQARVLANLGQALYRAGDFERALECLAQAETARDDAAARAARFGRALCLYRLAEEEAGGTGGAAELEEALVRARNAAALFRITAESGFLPRESAGNRDLALALAVTIEHALDAARTAASVESGSAPAEPGEGDAGERDAEGAVEGAAAAEGGRPVERGAALGEDPLSLSPEAMARIFRRLEELKEARRVREALETEQRFEREMDW